MSFNTPDITAVEHKNWPTIKIYLWPSALLTDTMIVSGRIWYLAQGNEYITSANDGIIEILHSICLIAFGSNLGMTQFTKSQLL